MNKVEFDDYLPKVEDAKVFVSYLWCKFHKTSFFFVTDAAGE
jgi:hypothetical protein